MGQMGQEKGRKKVVEEYVEGGVTLRELSERYGISRSVLHRLVKAYRRGEEIVEKGSREEVMAGMSNEVKQLQRELYEARLEAELYRTMVEIAEKDLGIPIRKKSGAKQ